MNDATRQGLLQLLDAFVGHERVIQIQLLQVAKLDDVRHARVGQLDGVEQKLGQLGQRLETGNSCIAHRGIADVQRLQVRERSDGRYAFVSGNCVLQVQPL